MLSNQAFKKFKKYGIVGIGTNVINYIIFLGMIWANIEPVLASGLCYVLGVTMSYYFNRRWTFQSKSSHRQDILRFLFAYGTGFILTIVSMNILTVLLHPEIAQILTICIIAVCIYIALHCLKFGEKV
jgi:putative flippase GtrA